MFEITIHIPALDKLVAALAYKEGVVATVASAMPAEIATPKRVAATVKAAEQAQAAAAPAVDTAPPASADDDLKAAKTAALLLQQKKGRQALADMIGKFAPGCAKISDVALDKLSAFAEECGIAAVS